MANSILNREYQDMLDINHKYDRVMCCSLTERSYDAFKVIVNLCARSITNYDKLKSQPFLTYTFGITRHADDKLLHPQWFSAADIEYYGDERFAGTTLCKLVRMGLLKVKTAGKNNEYIIPDDLFTTNFPSLGLYQPINTDF